LRRPSSALRDQLGGGGSEMAVLSSRTFEGALSTSFELSGEDSRLMVANFFRFGEVLPGAVGDSVSLGSVLFLCKRLTFSVH
jgi:hypothetical protein